MSQDLLMLPVKKNDLPLTHNLLWRRLNKKEKWKQRIIPSRPLLPRRNRAAAARSNHDAAVCNAINSAAARGNHDAAVCNTISFARSIFGVLQNQTHTKSHWRGFLPLHDGTKI